MEPLYDAYRKSLKRINKTTGKFTNKSRQFEGSIFYVNGDNKRHTLYKPFRSKRVELIRSCLINDVVVEIGVNAGHSALLALTANSNLVYCGVDIGHHGYTVPCASILESTFPNRFFFHKGDSRNIIPVIFDVFPFIKNKSILWIIDGSHDPKIADLDIQNVIAQARNNDTLIFDDIDRIPLHDLIEKYIKQGQVTTIKKTKLQWLLSIKKNLAPVV